MATSLVLIHKDAQSCPVNHFNALIDPGSSHATSAPTYGQLALPDVVLDLAKLLVLTLQLLLIDTVTLHLGQCALVVEVEHRTVDFGTEVMVVLEKFELTRGVGAEGSCRWEWSGLERLNVLMGVPVDHAVDEGIFSILQLDILGRLHLAAGESDVEGDVVSSLVQYISFWDLRLWSVIFPSKLRVSLRPFVGTSRRASCS